ncbi:FecR family protein [Chitinophaga sp. GCM10012297]|uniref:FecR domain-containing protein n=1 Tax=Chitinophaga chungangae TaxID=2821488 RepID=A0ABS3Y7Y5_9BACT|nr:FecR family protein [Chitinophaga chungangae]MBO9150781.1 FecR domain-containing protein [Chitinophaga chungangae]
MQPDLSFNEQLREALRKHWAGQPLSENEQALLDEWLAASPDNRAVWEELNDEMALELQFREWNGYDRETVWRKTTALRRPAKTYRLYRWAAAAAAILLIAAAAYLLRPKSPDQQTVAQTVTDVAPGGSKAVLVLADGSTVTLDSAGNQVIRQGSTAIRQQAGQLRYEAADDASEISYNTLKTPRGGQFRITLPDGTGVWLNAESSLRFPTAFRGKERLVEVSGEAYFEVAKDAALPFRVNVANRATIEVLGTNFNVNAYEDESEIAATLLSGAVKVGTGGRSALLKPGQQARVNTGVSVMNGVDIEKVMAWKNGVFNFKDAKLKEVMKQLSRWYDIEVEYRGNVPDTEFWGKMGRNLTLLQVLNGLEATGIHFKLEDNGKKLVVLP